MNWDAVGALLGVLGLGFSLGMLTSAIVDWFRKTGQTQEEVSHEEVHHCHCRRCSGD